MRTRMHVLPSTSQRKEQPAPGTVDTIGPPVVFVADDDRATLDLLCEIARDAGWIAQGFTSLNRLRGSLEESRPTLLILDDDLPDGRGGDLARELRNDEGLADIPILVCTAAHPMRRAEIGTWAPIVSKPFNVAEIDAFLGAAARQGEGSGSRGQRAG